jgi:hypothetical protein
VARPAVVAEAVYAEVVNGRLRDPVFRELVATRATRIRPDALTARRGRRTLTQWTVSQQLDEFLIDHAKCGTKAPLRTEFGPRSNRPPGHRRTCLSHISRLSVIAAIRPTWSEMLVLRSMTSN